MFDYHSTACSTSYRFANEGHTIPKPIFAESPTIVLDRGPLAFSIHYVPSRQNKKKTFVFSGGHKRSSFDGRAFAHESTRSPSPPRIAAHNTKPNKIRQNTQSYNLFSWRLHRVRDFGVRHLIGTRSIAYYCRMGRTVHTFLCIQRRAGMFEWWRGRIATITTATASNRT